MPYDILGNLEKLKEKIKDLEIRINAFKKNQLGTVSGDVVKSGTDEEIPVVESETVSGPVIPREVNVNPLVGNVKAKVETIEQNIEKNSHLLNESEFELLSPMYFFGEELELINKFLNILTIIEKNSNNANATIKSKLDDTLKEKYITKGQTLFDETTKHIIENIDIFCNEKKAINVYFELYNIIQKFYSNLIKTPSSYGNLYKIMKQTKQLKDDTQFNNYIINLIHENDNKYVELKNILFHKKCITGNENFNLKTTRGGRKSRKIKHRKTKRRGKGHKKSHKKRHSKSHKKGTKSQDRPKNDIIHPLLYS
jgi:hypothetical protein